MRLAREVRLYRPVSCARYRTDRCHRKLSPISRLSPMITGNSPYDGGNLILGNEERSGLLTRYPEASAIIKRLYGSRDFLNGEQRYCLWIDHESRSLVDQMPEIQERIEKVRLFRLNGGEVARGLASHPYQFRYTHRARRQLIIVPRVSSERRKYIPFGLLSDNCIINNSAQAIYDAEIWHLSILLSLLHMAWVRTIAGRLKNDLRYSRHMVGIPSPSQP